MKKIGEFFNQLFSDVNGKFSSKRVFAFVSFIVAIVMAIFKDVATAGLFLGQATILFGATVAEKGYTSDSEGN